MEKDVVYRYIHMLLSKIFILGTKIIFLYLSQNAFEFAS